MDTELLKERAAIIRSVRGFFDGRSYLEVDTPLLAPDLIPESCLEVFETERLASTGKSGGKEPLWLIPSPEIWMKKLIAKHKVSMYQICKCFRNGESAGFLHNPEFTMLEYYTMGADYRGSLAITESLLASLPAANSPALLPIEQITMEEAFLRWAGFDLYEAAEKEGGLEREARRLGIQCAPGLSVQELYDLIFIHAIEPALPRNGAVALMDYPAFVPCLAKKQPGGKTVERWELYVSGIELANCYSEETGPDLVKQFFESEAAEKEKRALIRHRVDRNYWKIFLPGNKGLPPGRGYPQCSGVALGIDRLIMAVTGKKTIEGVLPFLNFRTQGNSRTT
jgi:lysyl-tRNA synthetase class 2